MKTITTAQKPSASWKKIKDSAGGEAYKTEFANVPALCRCSLSGDGWYLDSALVGKGVVSLDCVSARDALCAAEKRIRAYAQRNKKQIKRELSEIEHRYANILVMIGQLERVVSVIKDDSDSGQAPVKKDSSDEKRRKTSPASSASLIELDNLTKTVPAQRKAIKYIECGYNLKRIRTAYLRTAEELAASLHVPPATICSWERSNHIPESEIDGILKVFHIDRDTLYYTSEANALAVENSVEQMKIG